MARGPLLTGGHAGGEGRGGDEDRGVRMVRLHGGGGGGRWWVVLPVFFRRFPRVGVGQAGGVWKRGFVQRVWDGDVVSSGSIVF